MSIIMMYIVPDVTSLLCTEYAWEQHAVHPTERKGSKDSGTKDREVAQDGRGKLCIIP